MAAYGVHNPYALEVKPEEVKVMDGVSGKKEGEGKAEKMQSENENAKDGKEGGEKSE